MRTSLNSFLSERVARASSYSVQRKITTLQNDSRPYQSTYKDDGDIESGQEEESKHSDIDEIAPEGTPAIQNAIENCEDSEEDDDTIVERFSDQLSGVNHLTVLPFSQFST